MRQWTLLCTLFLVLPAWATVPPFAADCARGVSVRADTRGDVWINEQPARLLSRPGGQTTAVADGIFIDITPQAGPLPLVTYTARDQSTGTCLVSALRPPASRPPSGGFDHPPSGSAGARGGLADTRWRLVEFQSMDGAQGRVRPRDPSAYTMHLRGDGSVAMRLDCNQAQGNWSVAPDADGRSGRFEFGPLAATSALCVPPRLDEILATQARFVRGYLVRDGRLYLNLMADGGVFMWEPESVAPPAATPDAAAPRAWRVTGASGAALVREATSVRARVIARPAPGTILGNLGCRPVEGRVWCDVQPLRGGVRGYLPAEQLAPAVGPDGTVPTGPDDSALRAGQGRFDARGTLPCSQFAGQPLRSCDYGVARAGGGYATVVVTRPDGRTRAIYFALGQAIGADTSQADGNPPFRAVQDGALYRVRIGAERYDVPRSVVLGR
jgi:hypothetical protein